jgi:hypothetical protein
MQISESCAHCDRRFAQNLRLASSVALLLCTTGCPELLDDDFYERDSSLSQGDAAVGGACGEATCPVGAAGGSYAGGWSDVGGNGNAGAGIGGAGPIAELRSCPFGEPEPLLGFDFPNGSEWGPSLTADGLTLFFAHETSSNSDLYRATRTDRGVTFSTPIALTDLNTAENEGTPVISSDGLRLYFYSTRAGGPGGRDLYVATRSDVAAEFASPELLGNVNSAASDHLPRLSLDELRLWFTSSRAGGPGAADVWTASRASIDAPFAAATVFSTMNGSSGDESAILTQDGLVLIFDSTRDGAGNSEIFVTTRTSADQPFPNPSRLSAVNSAENEYNVFLTLDERELFFSSNRNTGLTHHLFRALRSCD